MNKTLVIVLIGLLIFSGTIVAQSFLTISLKPATIEKVTPTGEPQEQTITYNCGKDQKTVTLSEPDGKIDENDLKQAIECDVAVTNIQYEGKTLQENKYGDKAFDELELKMKECSKDGNVWKDDHCEEYVEPKVEEYKDDLTEEDLRDPIISEGE